MSFQNPYLLLLAPAIVAAAAALYFYSTKARAKQISCIVAPKLVELLTNSVNYKNRKIKYILFIIGLVFLIIALARPLGAQREVKIERPGADVIIALDISRSMDAEDTAQTNRISAAKHAIRKLLQIPSNHRFGLVAFAGEAYLIAPITLDHGSVLRSVEALKTGSISKPGTDIAAAIKKAVETFDPKKKSGKAVILITDGEQLQGDAITAAREAMTAGVRIFTIGVGTTTGAKIPDRQKGRFAFAKNEFGAEVVTRLNENVLKQIANAGQGYYIRLGDDGEGLLDVASRGISMVPTDVQIRKSKDRIELFQIPLAISLCIFLLEPFISERKKFTNNQNNAKL
ncbi:MAG: VWA domain-containing protein [Limisphaerales bacterium]|jgi:Ca-activated chloride channel family protein